MGEKESVNPLNIEHFTQHKLPDEKNEKIGQGQFYDLITSDEVSWQAIIYDLVKTEQLDPWDINLSILTNKYMVVIEEMEEANFFVSSKVLLACALLLRLKSEILTNKYIQDLNEALYGRKEEQKYELERIEIDEDELPLIVPKTPIPRSKKVTLDELMAALNKAIETENRRIKKEIKGKQAEKSALVVLPKVNRVPLKSMIRDIFSRIKEHLKKSEVVHMKYSDLAPSKEEKLSAFLPVLHLANQEKVHVRQDEHFDEIYMALEKAKNEIELQSALFQAASEAENINQNIDFVEQ